VNGRLRIAYGDKQRGLARGLLAAGAPIHSDDSGSWGPREADAFGMRHSIVT
jgi:hypothetical protein